jgi:hypothetical protein
MAWKLQERNAKVLTTSRGSGRRGTNARLKLGLARSEELVNALALKVTEKSGERSLIHLTTSGSDDGGHLLNGGGLLTGDNKQSVSGDKLHDLTKIYVGFNSIFVGWIVQNCANICYMCTFLAYTYAQ